MIKKLSSIAIGALMLTIALVPLAAAHAQSAATMPALYNAQNQQVNMGNTAALPAGYYFLGTGSTQQVYYYGNGTYYNPATGEFGGSVNNPFGTAGVSLGYTTGGTVMTPGVPNTGAGGDSLSTWMTLAISAAIVLGGATYLVATRKSAYQR